jgi:hypothetical protein
MAVSKNLDNLSKLLATLDENHLSKADFQTAFNKVMAYMEDVNKKNRSEFELVAQKMADMLNESRSKLENDALGHNNSLTKREEEALLRFQKKLEAIESAVEARLGELKDGESPAVEAIVEAMKPFIPAPLQGSPDTAEDIRNKLELLEGEERLSIEAIRGLSEELKKIRPISGGGVTGRDIVKNYDLSPYLDGVTKTFNIPGTWSIIGVYCSSFPHALRPVIDYTNTDSTITFTSQIDETTTLATGQTVVMTIVSA